MNDETLAPADLEGPYKEALEDGAIAFQRCTLCLNAWLPSRWECPSCLETNWIYERASGHGKLISWAVYHKAYHPSLEKRIPYNIAIVELSEGPRLITNLTVNTDMQGLTIDTAVELVVEDVDGAPLPRFRLLESGGRKSAGD